MQRNLTWSIKSALFEFSDDGEKKQWVETGCPISFEFDPENSDDGAESIMGSPEGQYFSLNPENSHVAISDKGDVVEITAQVRFRVELNDDGSEEDFDEWSSDCGGWACATISPDDVDAYISEDSGGDLTLS